METKKQVQMYLLRLTQRIMQKLIDEELDQSRNKKNLLVPLKANKTKFTLKELKIAILSFG
jgi:hypothetical protein